MHEAPAPVVPRQRWDQNQNTIGMPPDGDLELLVAGWTRDASGDPCGWTVASPVTQTVRSSLDMLMHRLRQGDESPDEVRSAAKRLGASLADLFRAAPQALETTQHELLTLLCERDADHSPDPRLLIEISTAFSAGFTTRSRGIVLAAHDHLTAPVLEVTGQTQLALYESDDRFRAVFDASSEALCLSDLDGNLLAANRPLLDMIGYDHQEFLQQSPHDLVAWPSVQTVEEVRDLLAGRRENVEFDTELVHADGHRLDVHLSKTSMRRQDGFPKYIVTLVQDISEHKRSEAVIRQSEQRIQDLIRNSSDIIAVISEDGVIEFISPAVQRVLGYQPDTLVGRNWSELITEAGRATSEFTLDDLRSRPRQTSRVELRALHEDGSRRWVEVMLADFEQRTGDRGFVVNIRDVSDRRGLQRQLERQAFSDFLTGLPNRLAFYERLDNACAGVRGTAAAVGMLFIDLDRFKTVNDWIGHDGGDQTLIAVGQRISDTLRPGEMVARLGGDEFAVLIEDATPASATRTALRMLRALARPVPVLHRRLSVEASIGIAVSNDALSEADALLRAADIAQYQAKTLDGATAVMFEPHMHTEMIRQITLETDLQAALKLNEIEPYFQPEYNILNGELVGFEVLMRWHRRKHGVMLPEQFLPIAEETGIIGQLGEFNFRTSCLHFRSWLDAGIVPGDVYLSFNLSHRETRLPDLVETVDQILREYGIDPARIRFEIPEHVLASSDERRLRTIAELDQLGAKLTIDQFGSGPSSLTLLEDLPVGALKMDHAFHAKALRIDPEGEIGHCLVRIAKRLNAQTTLVGIQTEKQLREARATGYHCGQGHHLSEPLTAQAIGDLLLGLSPGHRERLHDAVVEAAMGSGDDRVHAG